MFCYLTYGSRTANRTDSLYQTINGLVGNVDWGESLTVAACEFPGINSFGTRRRAASVWLAKETRFPKIIPLVTVLTVAGPQNRMDSLYQTINGLVGNIDWGESLTVAACGFPGLNTSLTTLTIDIHKSLQSWTDFQHHLAITAPAIVEVCVQKRPTIRLYSPPQ